MYILGINAWHGDASATLLKDGEVVLAIEEERINRKKHCAGFPSNAIQACLDHAGITIADVDHIGISTNPSANLKEKVSYSLKRLTRIHKMLWDRMSKVFRNKDLKQILAEELGISESEINAEIHRVEHHICHLASAWYPSSFKKAALLTLDGMGDFVSAKWGYAEGNEMTVTGQVEYPHSIGYFYTTISQYIGFTKYGDEGKVMGLAPYGNPVYMEAMEKILQAAPDGEIGYQLGLDYFRHDSEGIQMQWDDGPPQVGTMYSDEMEKLLGVPPRTPDQPLEQVHKDIAASLQQRVEDVVFEMLNRLAHQTNTDHLCMAGGVALNSVLNGKIRHNTPFREIYIHPNAGDGGTSLGAALYIHSRQDGAEHFSLPHAYLGDTFSDDAIRNTFQEHGIEAQKLSEPELIDQTARAVADGKVVGWYQGAMEWGPRALGSRSIVADPRRDDMKDILNARIKKREKFRPFAPSVLADYTGEFFEDDYPAPNMLMVYPVKEKKRSEVPAITHVDGSGRLQTVHRDYHPRYYDLIDRFRELTGVPMVLNTSFNENEPVVHTPEEALDCFLRTRMDVLVIGDYFLDKEQLNQDKEAGQEAKNVS